MGRNIGVWQILLVLLIILLLFGARKLPDLARSVGQSLKIFRKEVKDLTDGEPGDEVGGVPDGTDGSESRQP